MRKKLVIMVVGMLSILSACTTAIEGKILEVGENQLKVDCSNAVNTNKKDRKDIGYSCTILLTDQTVLTDKNGKQVTIEDIAQGATVKVTLTESRQINQTVESREFSAKKVLLIQAQ